MRAEHWYDFGSLAGNSDLFVQVVAHITAAVPNSVPQYLKAGQITPLAKLTGGHRPLLMMSFLRRLALKSVMAAKKESVAKCAGPLQYDVGVDFQLPLTLYSGHFWRNFAHITTQAPNFLPTWTTGTCGSNRSAFYRQ